MPERRARLRQEYRDWYPELEPGVWHNAAWLAELVIHRRRRAPPTWSLQGRPLPEAHFEFEGIAPPQGRHRTERRILSS